MSSPLSPVLDLLVALGEVEWVRSVGGDDPLEPPYLVWRFKVPNPTLEARIVGAVLMYSSVTKWTIRKGGRNWVIELLHFEDYSKAFRVDVDASRRFGLEFPDETRSAIVDAERLAEHLRRVLIH